MAEIDPDLSIASVQLDVSDLPRSVDFYERVLGLPVISRDEHRAQLGPKPARPALELREIAAATLLQPRATGLYHVAWLHPSRGALAETARRIAGARWRFEGASDHGVSEALYLGDPDGLGIEIYADRPRELWERPGDGLGVRMFTLPLDVEDLLAQFAGEPAPSVGSDVGIGHVHLKVADVPRSSGFYRDALGLQEQAQLPSAAFLAAGGYHHHVGLNSWQSRGAARAPDSAPGLRQIELELSDADALDALERGVSDAISAASQPLREDGGRLSLRDPDGQLLSFTAR
ncbi:MAG: VOC family protein [Solirubrobacteraceae bacterium]